MSLKTILFLTHFLILSAVVPSCRRLKRSYLTLVEREMADGQAQANARRQTL